MDAISAKNVFLFFAILTFAVAKIAFSSGVVNAAVEGSADAVKETKPASQSASDAEAAVEGKSVREAYQQRTAEFRPGNWSEVEKQLLTQLDSRRVELEKRRHALDEREAELQSKETALSSRLAELRSLTRKLSSKRKQQNHRYEARLEQLANVYGSMPPNEAAPLIAQLDDKIALALLERMPGKRMGQILSMMQQKRAVGLTVMLTERGSL